MRTSRTSKLYGSKASRKAISGLIEAAANLDEDQLLNLVTADLFADAATVAHAADIAVATGRHNLLAFACAEVCDRLVSPDPLLRSAAQHMTAAVLLADDLSEADVAALMLPWTLGYEELPGEELPGEELPGEK